jgi:nucleoside-diphosphate-sugar epimerase
MRVGKRPRALDQDLGHGFRAQLPLDLENPVEALPVDDPRQRQPDITLADKRLGWRPRISLDEGLRPTMAYFRDVLGA